MKKIILLMVSCLFSVASFSQEIEWQNAIGGSIIEQPFSVQQTADGGYIMGGYSISNISGDKTEDNIGGDDFWIVKTDAAGNVQWENTIGGNDDDMLQSIRQTADGGYILGGYSVSDISGDKTENSNGGWDYWIVKTDASGTIQWQNTIGGSSHDYLYSVQQTIDGGYILGGYSQSPVSGDKTESSNGSAAYWIVKTDSTGNNIEWQNTIGGSSNDYLYSIQQTADGGYILGGRSYSNISFDKTEDSNGDYDYWIIKTDTAGTIQWQNTIGGDSTDYLNCIRQTTDGGYILGGWSSSNSSGDKSENRIGFDDYWIVKTDSSGNIEWENTIGGSGYDRLYYIQQDAEGGYIFGGFTESNISGDKTENCIAGADYWVVKTDSSGSIQWQNSIGGAYNENLYSMQQTADQGCILGGWSNSHISGDKTEDCLSNSIDYWLVKLTNDYNRITGKLFIDANSNNVQDAGEPAAAGKMVTEINTNRFSFSQLDGSYNTVVLDSGNYSVYPASINYYTAVPAAHSAYFSGIQQTDSVNDFAFQPSGVFNDLCVDITPYSAFRPGFPGLYKIDYQNWGTTTLNPTVIFFPDNVTFSSANITPSSVTTDSVVWNFGPLAPFQSGTIYVIVFIDGLTPIGTLVNSATRIEPVAGDANPGCNYSAREMFVTASLDPNVILVDRDTVLTTELLSPPYLDYIIYFQNTGNDTAFNVKVLNPIDTFKLDIHSFEFVASSHPVNINYKIWERNMEFTFENILLPDSGINEPGSHGFIRYRIKPNTTLLSGDSINNTAFIYFDFNAPVQTNTAVTVIVLPTGVSQWSAVSGQLMLYPNPAANTLTIKLPQLTTGYCQLATYDLFGREVFKSAIQNPQSEIKINVSGFSQGVYFMELRSGEQVLRGKFLKE